MVKTKTKLLTTYSLFFLLYWVTGCSINKAPPVHFEDGGNFRAVAGIEEKLSESELKLHSCFDRVKNDCYSKSRFIETTEIVPDPTQNYAKKEKFHSCVLDESIQCAYEVENQVYIDRLNNLKKEYVFGREQSYLAWTNIRNYDPNELFNLFDQLGSLARVLNNYNADPSAFNGLAIDNRDLMSLKTSFQGMALKRTKDVILFCHPELPWKYEERAFFNSLGCSEKSGKRNPKLVIFSNKGQELVAEFNLKKFAQNITNLEERLNGNFNQRLSKELQKIMEMNKESISIELAIASEIIGGPDEIMAKFLSQRDGRGELLRKTDYLVSEEFKNFLKILGESIDGCIVYNPKNKEGEFKASSETGVYLINYMEFGSFELSRNNKLEDINKLELMNPFLLNKEQLKTVLDLADQFEGYERSIRLHCDSSNNISKFTFEYILNEIL